MNTLDATELLGCGDVCRGCATLTGCFALRVFPDWTTGVSNGYSGFVTLASPIDKLTPREREILLLASERLGDKEIALQLNLSPRTVQNHLHRAYEKLGVSDRLQAARVMSNCYSGRPAPLFPMPPVGADRSVVERAVAHLEGGKTSPGDAFRGLAGGQAAALKAWPRPPRLGGSVLWLILLWALAWVMVAVIGASLINPVLEVIERLR
ncbi:helix-turn-helix domain-containing protein [Brevundimonas diminuta]|uniref:helix-turn-helix domain-containing protein n=1 Tax=Brevundimonas diminuta TaxID=293 RepID=UPI003D070080